MMLKILDILKQGVRKAYDDRNREGVHVSDLVLCIRKSVLNRLDPQPLTDIDIRNFNQGLSHHHTTQQLAKEIVAESEHPTSVEVEKSVKEFGVLAHVDLVINGIPVEIKTTRSAKAAPSDHYYTQLRYYMVMLGQKFGKILVESYNAKENPWSETDVELTDDEMEMHKNNLIRDRDNFNLALEKKDWKLASHVKNDKRKVFMCMRCPYKTRCYDIDD